LKNFTRTFSKLYFFFPPLKNFTLRVVSNIALFSHICNISDKGKLLNSFRLRFNVSPFFTFLCKSQSHRYSRVLNRFYYTLAINFYLHCKFSSQPSFFALQSCLKVFFSVFDHRQHHFAIFISMWIFFCSPRTCVCLWYGEEDVSNVTR
jgi:hypothetical protein